GLAWALPAAVLAGVSTAAMWLTRQDGGWLLPAAALVVLVPPFLTLLRWWLGRRRRTQGPWPVGLLLRRGGRVAGVLAVAAVNAVVPIAAVAAENSSHFGAALTNDMSEGTFPRAYADWMRVNAGPDRMWIPITKEQRTAVYAVSAAARELRP